MLTWLFLRKCADTDKIPCQWYYQCNATKKKPQYLDCFSKQRHSFSTSVTGADDSNNRVACTDHVRSSLSLADNLTNKHITTRSPFYTVQAHTHVYIHKETHDCLKDLKAHTIQVLVWIITGRLRTVVYTYIHSQCQEVHIHPFSMQRLLTSKSTLYVYTITGY